MKRRGAGDCFARGLQITCAEQAADVGLQRLGGRGVGFICLCSLFLI